LGELQEEVADLAFASACKILGRKLTDRETAVVAVAEVLGRIKASHRIRVGLAPDDFAYVSSRVDVQSWVPAGTAIEIESDASVRLGGCVVRGDHGEWDGRLETQLALLHQALQEARRSAAGAEGT